MMFQVKNLEGILNLWGTFKIRKTHRFKFIIYLGVYYVSRETI